MITKEEYENFKKFYAYLRPLVVQKLKEKYEIEFGKPFPSAQQITKVDYDIEEGVFSIQIEEWGKYSCHDYEYYTLCPKYLYNESAMSDFKKEVEERKRKEELQKKIKSHDEEQKKMDSDMRLMQQLADKYGFEIFPKVI